MKKKVIINAMGKRITIDNPNNIDIMLKKGKKPYILHLNINKSGIKNLVNTVKKINRRMK